MGIEGILDIEGGIDVGGIIGICGGAILNIEGGIVGIGDIIDIWGGVIGSIGIGCIIGIWFGIIDGIDIGYIIGYPTNNGGCGCGDVWFCCNWGVLDDGIISVNTFESKNKKYKRIQIFEFIRNYL